MGATFSLSRLAVRQNRELRGSGRAAKRHPYLEQMFKSASMVKRSIWPLSSSLTRGWGVPGVVLGAGEVAFTADLVLNLRPAVMGAFAVDVKRQTTA